MKVVSLLNSGADINTVNRVCYCQCRSKVVLKRGFPSLFHFILAKQSFFSLRFDPFSSVLFCSVSFYFTSREIARLRHTHRNKLQLRCICSLVLIFLP